MLGDHPEVWQKTVFMINFDEFDGYFDHVPRPMPPAGKLTSTTRVRLWGWGSACR